MTDARSTTPLIDPRAVRMFEVVCKAGSISGAARILNISQPSVSNGIALLEARLGTPLFQRTRNGIVLYPAGSALLRHAQGLEAVMQNAVRDVEMVKHGIVGALRIGGTPGALVSLVPEAVRKLEGAAGRISLHVIERPDAVLTEMLLQREIDIAFVTTEIETPMPGVREITLARDPFALIVGQANFGLPDSISLKDAGDFSWVLPEAVGAFRRQVSALFTAAALPEPHDAVRCDSLLVTKAIVRESDKVTILPREVAAAELSVGVLRAIPIIEAAFERSIGARVLADEVLSPLANMLLELMGYKP